MTSSLLWRHRTIAALGAGLIIATAHAAGDVPTEPSNNGTALAMLPACINGKASCVAFMGQVRDWMLAHPETYGRLCYRPDVDIGGGRRTYNSQSNEALARVYQHVSNQTWAKSATAKDAAIWVVQSQLECQLQVTTVPGEPGFPTKLR